MNQEFGVGDIAMLDDEFKVKVTEVFQDDDDSWWYAVVPVDFEAYSREVEQSRLTHI